MGEQAKKTLRLEPHHIRGTDEAWWYETPSGIEVVVQVPAKLPNGEKAIFGGIYKIGWKAIRNALERVDA